MVMFFVVAFFPPASSQVPNHVAMQREAMEKKHLEKYKAKRRIHHIHRAAAHLWAHAGVPWDQALATVTEAFDATTFECQ